METKKEVFERYQEEYWAARVKKNGRKILTGIIDTVADVTGMGRKSIIRAFKERQMKDTSIPETRGRPLYYTADVTVALKEIWEAGNEVCGELLHPMVSEYVSILKRDKMWNHGEEATGKLLAMSEGTMKNRVGEFLKARRKGKGMSSTSPSLIKNIIPIFHGDWSEKLPGVGQIDTVVHCRDTLKGDYVFTLNYTDVSTLWCILRAQWNKGQVATQESLAYIRVMLMWKMLEVHPDTGSEFINWHLKGWCDMNNIAMTRSRPNHKNDNAHVEERNGHIVRKHIGYIRLDCKQAVDALNDVYVVLNPYLNHFVASKRLLEKYEVNGKWKKKYEKIAKTPYQRVLENEHISNEVKEKLKQEHEKLNPKIMKKEIDRLKKILYDTQKKYGTTEF
ncbi:MAG: hypothetical protein COW60_00190 [Candidatus Yonathbacteria bacterium CG17_big_fil_post_rev_8_21_14_2_50_43_9]|nr:MAG: hypothetical protein COW60_00190 [Candidatus Yonathbacteria bacterium CG17_big_fil_post_rev_8_21_14_2_50_43_9]